MGVFERLSSVASQSLDGFGSRAPVNERLASDQVGIPAELKHINKRRKRNQQGLPQ